MTLRGTLCALAATLAVVGGSVAGAAEAPPPGDIHAEAGLGTDLLQPEVTGSIDGRFALRPALDPAGGPARATLALAPPFTDSDGLTILSPSATVRLSGITGPAQDEVCLDARGRMWACGLQARAALRNLIRDKVVICMAVSDGDGGSAVSPSCRAGDVDVSRRLVSLGMARPDAAHAGAFASEMEDARAAARGLWDGNWTVKAIAGD